MFSKNKSNNMARKQEKPDSKGSGPNMIGNGTEIKGNIKSSGDIRIDGKLEGNIVIKGRFVVGPTGIIEGDIICRNAEVHGTIIGKITITELIALKENAKITGDIITNKISIEPGALFTGTCSMDGAASKQNKAVGANR